MADYTSLYDVDDQASSNVWSVDDSGLLRGCPAAVRRHPKCNPALALHDRSVVTEFLARGPQLALLGTKLSYAPAD